MEIPDALVVLELQPGATFDLAPVSNSSTTKSASEPQTSVVALFVNRSGPFHLGHPVYKSFCQSSEITMPSFQVKFDMSAAIS